MSEESKTEPWYDEVAGELHVPAGYYDPPPGTRAVDTGLRTSKGHPIKIRKVPLSERRGSVGDEEHDDSD